MFINPDNVQLVINDALVRAVGDVLTLLIRLPFEIILEVAEKL